MGRALHSSQLVQLMEIMTLSEIGGRLTQTISPTPPKDTVEGWLVFN